MADQANVTSLDALELFRTNLIVFLEKAHRSVDSASDEIRRTRNWIQNDRRTHWEGEVRRRRTVMDQAKQELFRARLSSLQDDISLQMHTMHKATRAFDEADEKLRNVRRWTRNYEAAVEPLTKKLGNLRQFFDDEMTKALASLIQMRNTLEAYAETAPAPDKQQPEEQTGT